MKKTKNKTSSSKKNGTACLDLLNRKKIFKDLSQEYNKLEELQKEFFALVSKKQIKKILKKNQVVTLNPYD